MKKIKEIIVTTEGEPTPESLQLLAEYLMTITSN